MFHTAHKGHYFDGPLENHSLVRAELALTKTVVWGGLIACALLATVYDVGRWVNFW